MKCLLSSFYYLFTAENLWKTRILARNSVWMRPFLGSKPSPKTPAPHPNKEGGKPPLTPLGLSGPRDDK